MSELPQSPEYVMDAFLDNMLSPDERRSFEQRLQSDPELQAEVNRRLAIDETMRKRFQPTEFSADAIESWLTDADSTIASPVVLTSGVSWRRWVIGAGAAIAAAAAWLFVLWQWPAEPEIRPFFQPRSLVAIYQETVDQGFRPYYFCEDETRFAETFSRRQQVPLRLAELPPERSMVGLSYLGGLSRDTTAMLCVVEDQPVVVFVDRKKVPPTGGVFLNAGTHQFIVKQNHDHSDRPHRSWITLNVQGEGLKELARGNHP